MKKFICIIGFILLMTGCFNRTQTPEETPSPAPSVNSAITTYTIILDGYKDGTEQRDFKNTLSQYVEDVKINNSGGNHAEYEVTIAPDKQDWLTQLSAEVQDRYTIQQEGDDRILFIRKE